MRIVFKIIAIFGLMSFLGGLMNEVYFLFGLFIAISFGYFGWRPNKESCELKIINDEDHKLKSNVNHQIIIADQKKINTSRENGTIPSEKYFKNRNRRKSYSREELINLEPLFHNDLVWKSGLKDWVNAEDLPELSEYVLERPPESKINKNIRRIQNAFPIAFISYILISLATGIGSGLLERYQYDRFIERVQPNIQKYFREQNEREEKLRQIKHAKELEIKQNEIGFKTKDKILERLQAEAYNNFLLATNTFDQEYYLNKSNDLLNQRQANYNLYNDRKELLNKNNLTSNNDNSIKMISYTVPRNTLYIYENGKYYSRWKVFRGVGNHEQISYEKTHRFLFRPYQAIFGDVNLSNDEIQNNLLLLINFIFSALVTNLILLPIIFLIVMRSRVIKHF